MKTMPAKELDVPSQPGSINQILVIGEDMNTRTVTFATDMSVALRDDIRLAKVATGKSIRQITEEAMTAWLGENSEAIRLSLANRKVSGLGNTETPRN